MASKASLGIFAAGVAALCGAGCENNDPCVRGTAACVDVVMVGGVSLPGDPLQYNNLTITLTDSNGNNLVPPILIAQLTDTSEKNVGVQRNPTGAGIYDVVEVQLPDSFNALSDKGLAMNIYPPGPCQVTDATTPQWSQALTTLRPIQQMQRATDPRAIHVHIAGTAVQGTQMMMSPVAWDSQQWENLCFSPSQICNEDDGWGYLRVGRNESINAIAYLEAPIPSSAATCPATGQ